MQICGEGYVNFKKTCNKYDFIGDFNSRWMNKCNVSRSYYFGYIDAFFFFIETTIYFENNWKGESLSLEFGLNNTLESRSPTHRVDFHGKDCNDVGSGQEEIYTGAVNLTENIYFYTASFVDDYSSGMRKDLKWNLRQMLIYIVTCPTGSKERLGSNSTHFACECMEGYYQNLEIEEFECKMLAQKCRIGTGPKNRDCIQCIFPYNRLEDSDGPCLLNDSIE